jgi:hypothetical protein
LRELAMVSAFTTASLQGDPTVIAFRLERILIYLTGDRGL